MTKEATDLILTRSLAFHSRTIFFRRGLGGLTHQAVDAVHVLSGYGWLGGLIPFILILRMTAVPELRAASIKAMRRFSAAGHLAIAIVLITGVANLWLTLGRFPFHLSSPYDQKL